MEKQEKKKINCAIYTRVSTTEGLEQEFTSLDNQRESAESYIQSQRSEGWIALPERYDDPGYTGANTERPALQKLLSDIKEGKINCIVVYKVDRLSRSLLDFSQLLESFEQNNVTFVSVTQAFNTNTSMGRLTLNILLSFAQFEREIISERTRDKMAASKKKGKWVGGKPPLGYDIDKVNRRLVINPKEADLVKEIFNLYLEKRSLLSVAMALNEKNYVTKNHKTLEGNKYGGVKFKNTSIQSIVKNPFYIGKVGHAEQLYQGEQERIISDEVFQKAQEILANNRRERKVAGVVTNVGLLNSILRCKACNSAMYYIYSRKGNNKYHYYLCGNAQKRGYKNCPTRLVSSQLIENKFMEFLRTISKDQRIEAKAWEALTLEEKIPILRSITKVAHYDANNGILEIVLHKTDKSHQFALTLAELKHIPYHRQQAEIIKEPLIRRNLILGYQISEVIKEKRCSIEEVANWMGMIRTRLCQFIDMLLLSPKIQEEILLSEEKAIFNIPEYKLRDIIAEVDWNIQQKLWNNLLKSRRK
ncbi:MAG: recombinase family protein [Candidatus Omnitrophota bacterium]